MKTFFTFLLMLLFTFSINIQSASADVGLEMHLMTLVEQGGQTAKCPSGTLPIDTIGDLLGCENGQTPTEGELTQKVKDRLARELARELGVPLWVARKIINLMWRGGSIDTIIDILNGIPFYELPSDIQQQLEFLAHVITQLKALIAELSGLDCDELAMMKQYLEAIDDGDGCISIAELVQWIALIENERIRNILQRLLHRYLTTIAPDTWCELIEQYTGINPCDEWGDLPVDINEIELDYF